MRPDRTHLLPFECSRHRRVNNNPEFCIMYVSPEIRMLRVLVHRRTHSSFLRKLSWN